MADIDTSLVGAVINALPLDKMISTPLMAMVQAQTQSAKAYVDFIMSIGIKDGQVQTAIIKYSEPILDADGTVKEITERSICFPILAMVTHPIVNIKSGVIDFECTIEQSFEEKKQDEAEGSLAASLGWGPFKVNVKGRVSHKAEQTRKTDTRAKYVIHVEAERGEMPEAMSRLIDAVVDASVRPMKDPNKKLKDDTDKPEKTKK